MNKLHRLPNGNWIDPRTVNSICVANRTEPDDSCPITFPDRVVLFCGDGPIPRAEVVMCDDAEQAAALADELAALVSQAAG